MSSLWDDLSYLIKKVRWDEQECQKHFIHVMCNDVPIEILETLADIIIKGSDDNGVEQP